MPDMVLKTRISYGFNGFQFPTIPKAPRSARRRGALKKTVDDGQICAFELLASLAGKLLQENQSSSASSNASEGNDLPLISDAGITQEQKDENKPLIADCLNHGSHRESAFVPELGLRKRDGECFLKEMAPGECDSVLEHASVTRNSDSSEKLSSDVKSVFCKSEVAFKDFRGLTEGGSPDLVNSCDCNIEKGFVRQQEAEKLVAGYMTMNNANGSKYPMDLCLEFPALVNSGSKVKLPICVDPGPDAYFIRHRNGVKLVSRDDDQKFLRCTKPRTNLKAFRTLTRTGNRRIRKLLTSKYWKDAPKLKNYDTRKTDGGLKPFLCHKRKIYQNRERCQYNSLYKRRKISDQNSVVISDGGFSSESISKFPEKGMNREKNGGNGVSPGVMGQQATFCAKDSHVKLSIKSFRVPELFVEVPETTTVGSLKRTVMEALTSVLGDGLHVGVVLRGRSIRDDNRTLSQTGISCKDNLDSVGFILESNIVQAPPPVCADDPCDTSELVSRSPVNPIFDSSDALPNPPSLTNSGKNVEFNNESVISHADRIVNHSRALVPVPAIMNIEALAMVPANQKPRRSEFVQRRTRRPFSVAEVEALVHAVEELGPGRWRDVKLLAFENADHRTYVDLKDKWKTLVHTGEIAPQQRRGAPVPQELLDRVLAAHAYWSHHQIKQPGKSHPGILNVSEVHSDKDGTEGIPLIM